MSRATGTASFGTSPLHVVSSGRGDPAVVLVHGFGGCIHSWRKWIPRLEPRHRVHAVDLMGAGGAATPAGGDYTPRAQADRLVELVRRLPDDGFVLAGHSLGTAVALLAALRMRDEGGTIPLAGLVLVSGAAYPQRLPPYLRAARIPVLGELLLLAPPPRFLLRAGIRGIVHRTGTVDREQVEGYLEPLRRFAVRRALLRAARQIDVDEGVALAARLPELQVPVLVLHGDEDRIVPAGLAKRMARDLPRARLRTFPGVGHLLPEEEPEPSVSEVLTFLADL